MKELRIEWLDALPVTFSLPLASAPSRTDFRVIWLWYPNKGSYNYEIICKMIILLSTPPRTAFRVIWYTNISLNDYKIILCLGAFFRWESLTFHKQKSTFNKWKYLGASNVATPSWVRSAGFFQRAKLNLFNSTFQFNIWHLEFKL